MNFIPTIHGSFINADKIIQLRIAEQNKNLFYIYADLINDDMIVIDECKCLNVAKNHLEKLVKKL